MSGYSIIVAPRDQDLATIYRKRANVLKELRVWARRHKRTGALAKSFTGKVRRRNFRFELEFKSSAEHSLYLEDGTPPHLIIPKRRKFLRFLVGKRPVFARVVHHPGTYPTHFMRDAVLTEFSEGEIAKAGPI